MEALILSCSTGGGHNAAAYAVKEELEHRGHHAVMLDPYSLAGHHWDDRVGRGYTRLAQKAPHLFGGVYRLGDLYRQLPVHSPVYGVNLAMCRTMQRYLDSHRFDVILMPHVYPAEILTCMKNRGYVIPKTIFIATDYVCIPFTEEVDCDYYITPGPELNADFIRRGIPEEKLVPAGIPVRREFYEDISKEEAKRRLGLEDGLHYLLLTGGSIGAGDLEKTMEILVGWLATHPNDRLIAISGSNRRLRDRLEERYGANPAVTLLTGTREMSLYMRACDAFISKPGGLSSTEAAILGTPLIHVSPIPGCEPRNLRFFDSHGMCLAVGSDLHLLPAALDLIQEPEIRNQLAANQRSFIPRSSAARICDLAEEIV